jgi:hypothetical protein
MDCGLSMVLANGVKRGRAGGSAMVRTAWIGLVCLIAICGLTAYKVGFATPAGSQAAAAPLAVITDAQGVTASNDAPETRDGPASKTDRLDVDYLQDVPGKTLVHTIPIVISNPAIPAAPAAKSEPEKAPAPERNTRSFSRHWRSSYARYTRRHFRHHPREVPRPTTETKSAPTGLFGWLKPTTEASAAKR